MTARHPSHVASLLVALGELMSRHHLNAISLREGTGGEIYAVVSASDVQRTILAIQATEVQRPFDSFIDRLKDICDTPVLVSDGRLARLLLDMMSAAERHRI